MTPVFPTNQRQLHLDLIRHKCVAANPTKDYTFYEPHLADVLLAIQNIGRPLGEAMSNVWWNKQERKLLNLYDLRKDNLTDQSDNTIKFIADLLV